MRRRLDQELVRRGLATGRDEAKRLIGSGDVIVDGSSMVKAATLVSDASAIQLAAVRRAWASRAGVKLDHALDAFDIAVRQRRALDVGASTGGFTDVLLSRGAASVTALDVGYGQLVWRLRQDPRVTVVDRTNFRTVEMDSLHPPFDVVTVDVSFISVRLLAGPLAAAGASGTDYVVLVKPQFEAGREAVGRGGVVRDPETHAEAARGVRHALEDAGLGSVGFTTSPIAGAEGNREFLLYARYGSPTTVGDELIATEVAR